MAWKRCNRCHAEHRSEEPACPYCGWKRAAWKSPREISKSALGIAIIAVMLGGALSGLPVANLAAWGLLLVSALAAAVSLVAFVVFVSTGG